MDDAISIGSDVWGNHTFTVPPRSKFYHLEPRGVGTPYVESLSGYATRLAREHFVTPYALLKSVMPLEKPLKIMAGHFSPIYKAVNGTGVMASNLIRALELLTMRNDLASTTMVTWVNVLSNKFLLRTKKAWCSSCYEEWQESGKVVYDPLLWTLEAVTICPLHKSPLTTSCPNCEAHLLHLASRSQPGFCTCCKRWLGLSLKTVSSNKTFKTDKDAKWQLWKAESMGELLESAPNFKIPAREQVTNSIRYCLNNFDWGTVSRFALQVDVDPENFCGWVTGKKIPSIQPILQITYRMGIPLLSFLCGGLEIKDVCLNEEIETKDSSIPKVGKVRLSPEEVKRLLTEATLNSSSRPEPLQTYVRLTGWGYRKLKKHYPELYAVIHTRYDAYYRTPVDYAKALRVLLDALKENPPPSIAVVSRRIGCRARWLRCHLADLSEELVSRYESYQPNIDWKLTEAHLKDALIKDPPLSLSEIARSLELIAQRLRRRFPELSKAIASRFQRYLKGQREILIEQLRQEISEALVGLKSEGLYPSATRVAARVKSSRNIFLISRILRAVERETASNTIL